MDNTDSCGCGTHRFPNKSLSLQGSKLNSVSMSPHPKTRLYSSSSFDTVIQDIQPVSYTHLDVYKRQV